MRPGGGKQKGAQFERDMCVTLSRWLTYGDKDDIFWRSAMSGGRATVAHNKYGKRLSNQVGDISCIDPIGNYFISTFAPECKFYASLGYEGLLTGKSKLLTFWDEIKKQAEIHGKYPILFARQNRMLPHVCLSKSGLRKLGLRDIDVCLINPPHNIYILGVNEFVKNCKPFV